MKLPAKLTKEEKAAKYGKWHLHFALWPVRVGTGESRWLEKVFRKLDLASPAYVVYGMNRWLYKSYEDGVFACLQDETDTTSTATGGGQGLPGVTTITFPPTPPGQYTQVITTYGTSGTGGQGPYIGSCSGPPAGAQISHRGVNPF